MRIMYTRANLRIRLFSYVISPLIHRAHLQFVRNHEFLRDGEWGGSANLFDNKGFRKFHIVIFWFYGFHVYNFSFRATGALWTLGTLEILKLEFSDLGQQWPGTISWNTPYHDKRSKTKISIANESEFQSVHFARQATVS